MPTQSTAAPPLDERERTPEGPAGLEIAPSAQTPEALQVLDPYVCDLVLRLHRRFEPRRRQLLAARWRRQAEWDAGGLPEVGEDHEVQGDWKVPPLPADLRRRRVEITGPVDDAKMVIGMLSRRPDGVRADAAMLDFEDSMRPTWENVVRGFGNLEQAVLGTLVHHRPAAGDQPARIDRIDPDDMPLLMVRGRGLHLDEVHLRVDGEPVAAGLFDLAVAVSKTAHRLIAMGRTPMVYIPKVEDRAEARWWDELLTALERHCGLGDSAVRATCLIETLPAALQVEAILYEARAHAAGLNVGRWDKIFSDLKVLMEHPDRVLGDRCDLTMDQPWMEAYAQRLIGVCHRHGALALGGMSAFTPGRQAEERERQTAKVLADKRREAAQGHDGCWVSHPYFIAPALEAFPYDNQLRRIPATPPPDRLLPQGGGVCTGRGLRENVRVGIAYLEGWLRGRGCIAFEGRMEDLATLEISRAQTWQWIRHGVELDDGRRVDRPLVRELFVEEAAKLVRELEASAPELEAAARLAARLYTEETFRPFLTRRWTPRPGSAPTLNPGLAEAPLEGVAE